MKHGRNDPCWCGSGKKYKKCHLATDEAATQTANAPRATPDWSLFKPTPPREPSPEETSWRRFWDDYKTAPLDARLTMAREQFASAADVDGELIFDLMDGLVEPLQAAERTHDLDILLSEIETRYPAAAAEEAPWFAMWRAENALLTGGDLLSPMLAWARVATQNIDMFHRMIDRLMFHGRLQELSVILKEALPHIEDSDNVMPQGIEAFRSSAIMLTLHQRLEAHPDLDSLDASLRAELASYEELSLDWIERFLADDAGRRPLTWNPDDVVRDTKAANKALSALTSAFGRALRVRWSWPRTRAELARETLLHALLDHRQTLIEKAPPPPKPKGVKVRGRTPPPSPAWSIESFLVPPRSVLDKAVAKHLSFLSMGVYQGAALVAALPMWLTFVAEIEPAAAEAARSRREELHALVADFTKTFSQISYDPAACDVITRAWEPAADTVTAR